MSSASDVSCRSGGNIPPPASWHVSRQKYRSHFLWSFFSFFSSLVPNIICVLGSLLIFCGVKYYSEGRKRIFIIGKCLPMNRKVAGSNSTRINSQWTSCICCGRISCLSLSLSLSLSSSIHLFSLDPSSLFNVFVILIFSSLCHSSYYCLKHILLILLILLSSHSLSHIILLILIHHFFLTSTTSPFLSPLLPSLSSSLRLFSSNPSSFFNCFFVLLIPLTLSHSTHYFRDHSPLSLSHILTRCLTMYNSFCYSLFTICFLLR